MGTFAIAPTEPGAILEDTVVVNGRARLLGRDPEGNPDFPEVNPRALYEPTGEFTFRPLNLRSLMEIFWGSEGEYSIPGDSSLAFRFSLDGGSTFVGGTGVPPEYLYQWFVDGPTVPHQLVVKAVFTASTDRKQTPELGRLMFYGDVNYDPVEDVVRTLKRVIQANAHPFVQVRFVHSGGNTLTLKSRIDPASLKIYREDYRNPSANLVQNYDTGTNIVTLTQSVASGTVLEYQGTLAWATDAQEKGALQVRIRPEPDYIRSHTPIYVVRHIDSERYEDGALAGDEKEKRFHQTGDQLGRVIERPTPVDLLVAIDAVAEREQEAYAMARQVRDLFQRDDATGLWQSLGMGYYLDIVDVAPLTDVSVPEDEFHDFQVRAIIGAKEYPSTVKESYLAERIEITVNNDGLVEVEG